MITELRRPLKPTTRHWRIKILCAELREIRCGIRKAQVELRTKDVMLLIRKKVEKRLALREALQS